MFFSVWGSDISQWMPILIIVMVWQQYVASFNHIKCHIEDSVHD